MSKSGSSRTSGFASDSKEKGGMDRFTRRFEPERDPNTGEIVRDAATGAVVHERDPMSGFKVLAPCNDDLVE